MRQIRAIRDLQNPAPIPTSPFFVDYEQTLAPAFIQLIQHKIGQNKLTLNPTITDLQNPTPAPNSQYSKTSHPTLFQSFSTLKKLKFNWTSTRVQRICYKFEQHLTSLTRATQDLSTSTKTVPNNFDSESDSNFI